MANGPVIVVVCAWLVAAAGFTAAGGLRLWPPPFPQLLLAGLVIGLLVAHASSARVRREVARIPTAALVGLHLSRFVGAYFLVLHARGELPWDFAVLGGWGDIAVAAAALLLLVRGRVTERARTVQVWSVLGLVDIVFVVAMAARNAIASPDSMAPILRLPLGLLPTFLVPLIIYTHIVILLRARRGGGESTDRGLPAEDG